LPVVDVYGFIEGVALTNAFLDDIDSSTFVTSTNVASINATLNSMSTVLSQVKTALDTVNTNLTNIYARQLATEIASYVDVKLPVTGIDITHAPVTLVGGLVVTAVGIANPLPVSVDGTVPVTLSAIDSGVTSGPLIPVALDTISSAVSSGSYVPVYVNGPNPLPVSGTVVANNMVKDITSGGYVPELGVGITSLAISTSGGPVTFVSPGAAVLSAGAGFDQSAISTTPAAIAVTGTLSSIGGALAVRTTT